MMGTTARGRALVFLVCVGNACAGRAVTTTERCVPGQQTSCGCLDGTTAVQVCRSDGTGYEPCQCAIATSDSGQSSDTGGAGGAYPQTGGYSSTGGGPASTGGTVADGATPDGTTGDGASSSSSVSAGYDFCSLRIAPLTGWAPVALYHLEEPGGVALVDSSGHSYAGLADIDMQPGGTIIGGSRVAGPCGQGRSVTLDGVDAHLELAPVGDVFGWGIAVELWVRPDVISPDEVQLIGDGGGGVESFQLVLVGGVPVFRLAANGGTSLGEVLRASRAVTVGQWQHLRAVYDSQSGDAALYVDGSQVARNNRLVGVAGSFNRIYAGGVMSVTSCCPIVNELVGELDELAIWAK